jgi:hypothetical protein
MGKFEPKLKGWYQGFGLGGGGRLRAVGKTLIRRRGGGAGDLMGVRRGRSRSGKILKCRIAAAVPFAASTRARELLLLVSVRLTFLLASTARWDWRGLAQSEMSSTRLVLRGSLAGEARLLVVLGRVLWGEIEVSPSCDLDFRF